MDSEDGFRHLLHTIADGLTEENVKMIKYLCKDIIALNKEVSCTNLFEHFESKGLIHSSDLTFLAEVLYRIHRHDLLKKLPGVKNRKDYEQNFLLQQDHQNFSPFRIACFRLTGELNASDFQVLKNFCRGKLSGRNYNKSEDIFMLLDVLEQEDLFSDGDLEFLISNLRQLDNQVPLKIFEQLRFGDHSFLLPNAQASGLAKPSSMPFRSLPTTNQPLSYPQPPPYAHTSFHSFPLLNQAAYQTHGRNWRQQPSHSSDYNLHSPPADFNEAADHSPRFQSDGCGGKTFSESDSQPTKNHTTRQHDDYTKIFMQCAEANETTKPNATRLNMNTENVEDTSLKQTYISNSTFASTNETQTIESSLERATLDSLGPSSYSSNADDSIEDSIKPMQASTLYQSFPPQNNDVISSSSQAPVYTTIENYPMDNRPAGLCLIINNHEFEGSINVAEAKRRRDLSGHDYPIPNVGLKNRIGSNHDVTKVSKLFKDFGFNILLHENLDSRDMKTVLVSTARENHSNYDSFVLVIMSHGTLGSIYGVDGMPVSCAEIKKYFKPDSAPTLLNKPKIFIYQACQGEQSMDGHVAPIDDIEADGFAEQLYPSTPSESDFLILYSTVPGYISYRSRSAGSFFIQSVVDNLRKLHGREDVLSIMTNVNAELARERFNQMAMPVSTLRKKVFFHSSAPLKL